MTANSVEIDLYGIDLVWFGADAHGHVAFFTTGGDGPVPKSVVTSEASLDKLSTYFYRLAPVRSDVVETPGWEARAGISPEEARANPVRNAEWREMAAKGLFSYHAYWREHRQPAAYFQSASPVNPLVLANLPDDIQQILMSTVLRVASFEEAVEIRAEDLGDFVPSP